MEKNININTYSSPVSLADIQEQIAKLGDMLNSRYKQLVEDEKKFEYEKATFDEAHRVVATFKDPIKLNIGGKIFMTSKSTLLKEESMLSAMFSGRHELEKGEDGAYFIDRDSKHFGKILNFLRDGEFEMRNDEVERKEILREAEFFSLSGLIEYLAPKAKAVPLEFDPIRKGPYVKIVGTTARNDNGPLNLYQPAHTSATFTSGVHRCTFTKLPSDSTAGVAGAGINPVMQTYSQIHSMMLVNDGSLTVAGKHAKTLPQGFSTTITMELDCDKRLITWITERNQHTEPLHDNLQAPFSFCVDLHRNQSVTLTELN